MSSLTAGIPGSNVISVFSSNVAGSFVAPRTVPATAVIITEPPIIRISRQHQSPSYHPNNACPRPVFDVGQKIEDTTNKLSPVLDKLSKFTEPISRIQSKISDIKAMIFRKLGLSCLIPSLLRPFYPILSYTRCKLGLNDDEFMETPPCNASLCTNPTIEEQMITRDLRLPNLENMIDGEVATLDDCFDDMEKVEYGARIYAKLVDDESCEDPRFASICQTQIDQNRILMDNECQSLEYVIYQQLINLYFLLNY